MDPLGNSTCNHPLVPRRSSRRYAGEGVALRESIKMTPPNPKPPHDEALEILAEEHRAVEQLFAEYQPGQPDEFKRTLIRNLSNALAIHTELETETFYPTVGRLLRDPDLVSDASEEHEAISHLVDELLASELQDELFEVRFNALREAVETHFEQEEGDLFPRIEDASVDLSVLADRLLERRAELTSDYRSEGYDDDEEDTDERPELD